MPIDSEVAGSLAYRKNTDAIWRGDVPEKYTRILPYVKGKHVLEIGSAEGVLALLMADNGHRVMAFEKRKDRHEEAQKLWKQWLHLGRSVDHCGLYLGDVTEKEWFNAITGALEIHMLVAVRVIYHLRDKAQAVIQQAYDRKFDRVLLCGNKGRAARHEAGTTDDNLGLWNYYASIPGMTKLLTNAGYEIETVVKDGDPIVVGRYPTALAA